MMMLMMLESVMSDIKSLQERKDSITADLQQYAITANSGVTDDVDPLDAYMQNNTVLLSVCTVS